MLKICFFLHSINQYSREICCGDAFGFCLQGNTMKLLWTYGEKDPDYSNLKWHGTFSGVRSIHMLTPMWKKPNHGANSRDARQWDVTVKNVSSTMYTFYLRSVT